MLLTGTFHRALDEKYRLALPKPLRDELGTETTVMYVAPGTDGSLALYTPTVFARLADSFAQGGPGGADVRAFGRMFYAQAQRLDLDQQGRLRLPVDLAKWASLSKDVVLLGVRDHVEIWDRASWDRYLADRQARYDEIADRVFRDPPLSVSAPATSPVTPGRTSQGAKPADQATETVPIPAEDNARPPQPR